MVKILSTTQNFVEQVLDSFAFEFSKRIPSIAASIKRDIQLSVSRNLKEAPEYQSMVVDGEEGLNAQFGFPVRRAQEFVLPVVNYISSKGVSVRTTRFRRQGNRLNGGISINIEVDFDELYNLPLSSYISSTDRGNFIIPWLEWLLEGGTSILVADFHIEYGDYHPAQSRSTEAIMAPGGAWQIVPTQYSGTTENNWITRSIGENSNFAEVELVQIVNRRLNA